MTDLLNLTDVSVIYKGRGRRGHDFRAVDSVSLSVPAGSAVALVGESGSGKTTIGRAILGLQPVHEGRIEFAGEDITSLTATQRRKLAKDLQVIFQDPVGSLNPSLKVGSIVMEPMTQGHRMSRDTARAKVQEIVERVGLPADAVDRYPSQFSGGQRQRIAIARALALGPRLVVCDEPTSALDVSTQAQVLELLRELREQLQLSYLFITHDLALVRDFCDTVVVLRGGRVVETGTAVQVCDAPQADYTKRLVAAAPVPDPALQRQRRALLAELSPSVT